MGKSQKSYNPFTVKITRYLSGFVGILVMSVFGVFPNEIINKLDEFWWIALFWIQHFINKNMKP